MYYRKAGTEKWFCVTNKEFIALGMSYNKEAQRYYDVWGNPIEIKHEPTKTPKQRRQQSIASMMRSATCIQAQLKFIQSELSKIDLSDININNSTCNTAKAYSIHSKKRALLAQTQIDILNNNLDTLNKYVALANKESRTPLTR